MKPIKKEIAIKCSAKEEAVELFEFLANEGTVWVDGERLSTDKTEWCKYEIDTCYFVDRRNRLCYGDCDCITQDMEVFDFVFDFIAAYQDNESLCDSVSFDVFDVL